MGRQAKLRQIRKTLKNESFMPELVENVGFIREKLISLDALPTAENVQVLFQFVSSIERPENMTMDEFDTFLDEKITDFIENHLK